MGSRNKENRILKESYITAKYNEKGLQTFVFIFSRRKLLDISNGKRQIPVLMRNFSFIYHGKKAVYCKIFPNDYVNVFCKY